MFWEAACPDFPIRSQPDWDLVQWGGGGDSDGQMKDLGTTGTESEDPEGALGRPWTPEYR